MATRFKQITSVRYEAYSKILPKKINNLKEWITLWNEHLETVFLVNDSLKWRFWNSGPFFFYYYLFRVGFFSVAYLAEANLVWCEIFAQSWNFGSLLFQYLVWLLYLCWFTGNHIIYPAIEGLLCLTSIEPVPKFCLQSSWITGACHYARPHSLLKNANV